MLLLLPLATIAAKTPKPRDDISISSANYAQSPKMEILRAVGKPQDQDNPPPPAPVSPATPQRYLFTRGEIATTDVTYEELCERLKPVLATRGFVEATNTVGRVPDPEQLKLILRVSYGEARWRNPTIRTTDLGWSHGLIPRAGTRSVGLTAFTSWENRSGGDDSSSGQAAATAEGDSGGEGTTSTLEGTDDEISTDDFFLIVVDAFDYHDLRKHRHHSKRVWTTFISVPRRTNRPFSEVADAMLAKAAPYFGTTTKGRVRFNIDKASVDLGEMRVVESDIARTPSSAKQK
ncbi:MAG: hypothetical protein Q8M02_12735 [Candidatus Didemnitutus sp.]|nr:hypothetical protein [Candidatus Didemnitutus sp.]